MNFFKRDSGPSSSTAVTTSSHREAPSPDRAGGKQAATYIAAGSRMEGEITGSAEVLVDGEFHGQLRLDSAVVVGREGRIQGEIQARSVRIEGRVNGNVSAKERVEVVSSASLEGDISAARVSVAEGAFFKGNVEMGSDKPGAAKGSSSGKSPLTHVQDADASRSSSPSDGAGRVGAEQGSSGSKSAASATESSGKNRSGQDKPGQGPSGPGNAGQGKRKGGR